VNDPTELDREQASDDAVRHADDVPVADVPAGDGPRADESQLSTGDPQVDAALARLAELDERPLDEHADVYADIHQSLGGVLDGSAGPADQAHPADPTDPA
jgi:hypothetical protein